MQQNKVHMAKHPIPILQEFLGMATLTVLVPQRNGASQGICSARRGCFAHVLHNYSAKFSQAMGLDALRGKEAFNYSEAVI